MATIIAFLNMIAFSVHHTPDFHTPPPAREDRQAWGPLAEWFYSCKEWLSLIGHSFRSASENMPTPHQSEPREDINKKNLLAVHSNGLKSPERK